MGRKNAVEMSNVSVGVWHTVNILVWSKMENLWTPTDADSVFYKLSFLHTCTRFTLFPASEIRYFMEM
jgi:hypothetical protein